MSSSTPAQAFWKAIEGSESLFNSFTESLARKPELCPATYGENNSFCLDILTLSHNAARQELNDMYTLCRAMGDLGSDLSTADVKACTLWFRGFYKFVAVCILEWHREELFPWFCKRVNMKGEQCVEMSRLYTHHEQIQQLAKVVYAKHGKLSAQVSDGGCGELAQVQFVDAICGATDLAFHLTGYFRWVESFMAPALVQAGTGEDARDEMVKRLVIRIQMAGSERMHLPMLVCWMSRGACKEWLRRYAIDVGGKRIPFGYYNVWMKQYFYQQHRKIVHDMVGKARA